jgi:GNAT superfamily N-acetyltransferase
MMQFVPIGFDQRTLAEYSALFSACFPNTDKYTLEYIAWLYVQNPDGNAFGFDAREDGVLAAHYVCIPAQARIDGQPVRVLLSLNTATHPRFQGKGLFTKLAAMTFEAAAAAGFEGVYGVANANSTPGFIRKLGFQLVRPLEAQVGIGRTGAVDDRARPCAFERIWTTPALEWRCANPPNPVACRRNGTVWQFQARAFGAWIHAYAELVLPADVAPAVGSAQLSPFRLYLGLLPDDVKRSGGYVSIPQRLRPSPLNLIYRSLATPGSQLDPAHINFSFLDFDAY